MRHGLAIWRSGRNRNSRGADWFGEFARFMGYEHAEVLDGFDEPGEAAVLVIPPGTSRVSADELSAVERAVGDGMGLLTYFDNSILDENGDKRTADGAATLGLSAVLGLDLASERGGYTFRVSGHQEVVSAADPGDALWRGVDLTGDGLPDGSPLPSFTAYNIRCAGAFGTTRKTRTAAAGAEVLARTRGHYDYWADTAEGEIFLAEHISGRGRAAYISYEALPPTGAFGLIHQDILFYWSFLRNVINRVSPVPLPRIMQMPGGVTNLMLRTDDAGCDDGHEGKWRGKRADHYHDTDHMLSASPYPMAVAVETDKVSTLLGEKRLKEWEKKGHVIVCHTRGRHAMNVDESEQARDLRESKETLERILGHPVVLWSVPGDYHLATENTRRLVAEAGYELAGEWVSLINDFLCPDACPLYPCMTHDEELGIFTEIITASGSPAIDREFNCRLLDQLTGLAEATDIPCLAEFVTHVAQGNEEFLGEWKGFMKDLASRLERRPLRMSDLAEQLDWARARRGLSLVSQAKGGELFLTLRNASDRPAREVTVDCGRKIVSASCDRGEPEVLENGKAILPEIPAGRSIAVKVAT